MFHPRLKKTYQINKSYLCTKEKFFSAKVGNSQFCQRYIDEELLNAQIRAATTRNEIEHAKLQNNG